MISSDLCRAVARTLIGGGGGGGCLFIYSCSARLVSFQIDKFKLISKETSRAEHEYMNKHPPPPPPINVLAMAVDLCNRTKKIVDKCSCYSHLKQERGLMRIRKTKNLIVFAVEL